MYECLRAIATLAAPILCFTCEDIWRYMPKRAGDPSSVHLATFSEAGASDAALVADFAVVLAWRERVTKALEPFRAQKRKSVDAMVTLHANAADRAVLARYADELADVFIVSTVTVSDGDGSVTVADHAGPRCERCWKHYDHLAAEPNDVCERCAAALAARK
jgi:isoleucyl-tRNA synthetase